MPEVENIPLNLQFRGVRGTSAKSPSQFAAVKDKLAYTAGGGVVVSTIGSDGEIKSQRLFVANNNSETKQGSSYLFYQQLPETNTDSETKRDLYGYPITQSPCTYEGSLMEINDSLRLKHNNADLKDGSVGALPSKVKYRVRAVSCLALSHNGRVLAVGEAGYRPRILLYSLAPDSSNSPFAVIYEHSFEVKSIAFSPDLRSFCSLGNLADGFLHVWKFTPTSVSFRAGNKCTSVVNTLLWHDSGSSEGHIITAGLRFLKVWTCDRAETSLLKSLLRGRNVVLGRYWDQNLQEALFINPDEVLVRGNNVLFVLSLRRGSLKFVPVAHHPDGLYGLLVDHQKQEFWYFDEHSNPHSMSLLDLKPLNENEVQNVALSSPVKSSHFILNISPNSEVEYGPVVKSYQWTSGSLIYLTDTEQIKSYNSSKTSSTMIMGPTAVSISGAKKAAGGELVIFSINGDVYSFPENECSKLIMSHALPQSDVIPNELTAVELTKTHLFLGDKFGQLSIFDITSDAPIPVLQTKAHSSTINEIIYFQVGNVQMLCSISRDRMIQLYLQKGDSWDLMGTLPTHNGNLISAKFSNSYLFVCSADRTVSVHEIVQNKNLNESDAVSVYLKKIITLKATPLAMDISKSNLILSTNDKCISIYDGTTLEFIRSIKLLSEETNDSLCVEKFTALSGSHIAVASTDKSLRIFHLVSGKHVSVAWGHSDATLGLFEDDSGLTSVGSDGCLFKWSLAQPSKTLSPQSDQKSWESTPDASPLYAKVTRKILPTPLLSVQSTSKRSLMIFSNEPMSEPESPTGRLTSATLRRLEVKKRLSESLVSTVNARLRYESSCPSKESLPTDAPPNKPVSSDLTNSSMKTTSLSRHTSPSRLSPRTTSPRKSQIAMLTPQIARLSVSKDSPVTTQPKPTTSNDAMERSTAHLAIIKNQVQKGMFNEENKIQLRRDLEEILILLGGSTYNDLLEKYSIELTSLVKEKLKDII